MRRRQFMKLSAAAGLSLVGPSPLFAQGVGAPPLTPFEGPYWLTINLSGAWDSTLFCDPKGDVTDGEEKGFVNKYERGDIVRLNVGGTEVPLAPGLRTVTRNGVAVEESYYHFTPRGGGQPVHILEHLSARGLTILNGVDAGLTNHRSGEQLAVAGSAAAGFPTLPALVAADRLLPRMNLPNGPMPLLSFGGYDGSGNLVPTTRLRKLDVLGQITQPNVVGTGGRRQEIFTERQSAVLARALDRGRPLSEARTRLPSKVAGLSQLFTARAKESHVKRLLDDGFDFEEFRALGTFRRQMYIALRAFRSGLSVSANLLLGGWDSHRNNDYIQKNQMHLLFKGLMYLKDEAESLGVADNLNIVVVSDFGRTTHYKDFDRADSGKDHHSVTSWMTMLWANQVDRGLRVIGSTDDGVIARPLNNQLAPAGADEAGVVMTPAIVHQELRRLALGEANDRFPLLTNDERLPLWG